MCHCILCRRTKEGRCWIGTHDWKRHRQAAVKEESELYKEDSAHTSVEASENASEGVEGLANAIFALTMNDSLRYQDSPDSTMPAHSVKPPTQHSEVGNDSVLVDDLFPAIESLLKPPEATGVGSKNNRAKGLHLTPPILRAVIRPVKTLVERRIDNVMARISTKRTIVKLQLMRSGLDSLLRSFNEYKANPSKDMKVLSQIRDQFIIIKREADKTKATIENIQKLKSELCALLDSNEGSLEECWLECKELDMSKGPADFDTG